MAVLTRVGDEPSAVYPLGSRCLLGRAPTCQVSIPFKENSNVSRVHAEVERQEGQYFIEDQGSRNGTFVNGRRLTARHRLAEGDRIGIGGVDLVFHEKDDAGKTTKKVATPAAMAELGAGPLMTVCVPVSPSVPASLAGYSGEKLRALVQMLKRLGQSLDIDATLRELLSGLLAVFPAAHSGFVVLARAEDDDLTPRATLFRRPDEPAGLSLSRTLLRHVLSRREAILGTDFQAQGQLAPAKSLGAVNLSTLMCAPLVDGEGNALGVVQIAQTTSDGSFPFSQEDLEVLVAAVGQAALSVRYAQLHEQALKRQALERDLQLAQQVQLGLLPEEVPQCPGYEFFAHYDAAYEVGGDFYDFVELPNRRLALLVADVAGKGVSAALLMAKLAGELRYLLSCEAPAAALARLNDGLCERASGRFVTLAMAMVDLDASTLTLLNAGHGPAWRRGSDGAVEMVQGPTRDMALGILPGQPYHEWRFALQPGDTWLLLTDGFTEAFNEADQIYGEDRLREQLARGPGTPRDAGAALVRDVLMFRGTHPQSDDMCLVSWGRLMP